MSIIKLILFLLLTVFLIFLTLLTFYLFKPKDNNMNIDTEKQAKLYSYQMQESIEKFKNKFAPYTLPNTLIELIKFDKSLKDNSYYSQSFYLNDDIEEEYFESWLDQGETNKTKREEYAKDMVVFARADGTGGSYAMWIEEGNDDLENAPIISYGSEGEIEIVAENLKDLIKMLSFGAEGMDGSFYHYLGGDEFEEDPTSFYKDFVENRPNFLKFRTWMKETLHIEPVDIECLKKGECDENDEINKLIEKAQKKYKDVFDAWQYQFYPDPKEEEKKYQEKQNLEYQTIKKEVLANIAKKAKAKHYLALAENENKLEKVNHKQKEDYFLKALELEPNNENALKALAVANTYSNYQKAITYYSKLIKISKEPVDYYSDLAYVYEKNQNHDKALEWYLKSIHNNENGWDCSHQEYIGKICKKLKKDAIEVLENSLKSNNNQCTYMRLYKLYFKKKNYKKASENAVKYIENSNKQAHNYTDISDKFLKKDLFKEALPILEKTLSRHDWDNRKMVIYNDIGRCYLSQEDFDKALEAFNLGYKLDPEEEALHQNIYFCGVNFMATKEYDKAKEVFEFCLEEDFEYEREETKKYLKMLRKKG